MKVCFYIALLALIPAIACTTDLLVTVEVTREVEVTQVVEATSHVQVTRQVQVTRVIEVAIPPEPRPICLDYPYMLALGELQLGFFNAQVALAERAVSGPVDEEKAARDWFADRLATTRLNQVIICGGDFEPFGFNVREMNSFEGSAVCTDTLDLLQDSARVNPDWDNAPPEVSEAWNDMMDGYVNYCDNHFLGS